MAVLASEGIVAGCVEVTEAGASDANTSKPLDEKSDNRGYVRTSAGVGDEGLPDPEVYEAARRIDEERWAYRFAKRAFDIVFSATVLVLFCWLYALIAMAIKIDDPSGPVFFKQERVGKNGERFMMWKFRSMYVNAEGQLDDLLQLNEKTGPVFKISKDPRITRVGRVIRKLSLDELPQFINVFSSKISIVGPRPCLPREVTQYTERQKQRLLVKPGITCYWQTRLDRDKITFDEWVELDLLYIKQCGIWTDLKQVAKTVGVVLTAQGN
ncbi:sugar transferase [Paraeggerthella sp. Marseille-Q4926]|uniref:sugar transferase n=1 Tax=Paraeggerthella sp. Marseille-Q4926 TaxID=2866587 RepID=UPI001CE40B1A|nr:sugar transferase [Paraeggerthella sp. Marseille-Q4926]